jgi:probable HAF family extracellular repeat protein
VNDRGVVAGLCAFGCNCRDPEPAGFERAWMYDENSSALTELTFEPSELGAIATDISDSGIITGEEYDAKDDPYPGYWTVTGGAMLLMGQDGQPMRGAVTVAVNRNGEIVGYSDNGTGEDPVLWSGADHSMEPLPEPACNQCGEIIVRANAINDSGTAVGTGPVNVPSSPTGAGNAALEWQGGTVTSLGTLSGGSESAASGINGEADVVGMSQVGPGSSSPWHAFLYHAGAMTDLGTLPGDTASNAVSINGSGEIVGGSDSGPFFYVNGTMFALKSLIDSTDPLAAVVQLEGAVSINAQGWIAVNGTDTRDGTSRAFLLIPSH